MFFYLIGYILDGYDERPLGRPRDWGVARGGLVGKGSEGAFMVPSTLFPAFSPPCQVWGDRIRLDRNITSKQNTMEPYFD